MIRYSASGLLPKIDRSAKFLLGASLTIFELNSTNGNDNKKDSCTARTGFLHEPVSGIQSVPLHGVGAGRAVNREIALEHAATAPID